jgi:hypothetical protein
MMSESILKSRRSMFVERIADSVAHNQGPIVASATSVLGTMGLASGAVPAPDSAPNWLPYLVTLVGPVLTMVIHRALSAAGAAKRARAQAKLRRAERLRADRDPKNDDEADKLEEEAASDHAIGDVLDRLGKDKV